MSASHHQQQSVFATSQKSGFDQRRPSGYTASQQTLGPVPHSGFESRYLENNYNKSIYAVLFLFSNTLLKFFDGEKCNQAEFESVLSKFFGRMLTLESQKLIPPKHTRSMGKLIKFLGLKIDGESISKHEASIKRLLLKDSYNQLSQEAFQTPYQQQNQSHSLEPPRQQKLDISSETKAVKPAAKIYRFDTEQSLQGQESSTPRRKKQKSKQVSNTSPKKASWSPPQDKHLKKQKKQSPSRQDQKSKPKPMQQQDLDVVIVQETHESETDREENEDQIGESHPNRSLLQNDSIHTIKEGDFTKEEDETMHEDSKELRRQSKQSHDSALPRSQLDISLSKVRSPLRVRPNPVDTFGGHSNILVKQEEYYQSSPPIATALLIDNTSPLKHQSKEYNDKTIKQRNQLDDILEQAKKEFKTDRTKRIKTKSNDYIETSATLNVGKKQRSKPLNIDEHAVYSSRKFGITQNTPPAIQSLRKPAVEGRFRHSQKIDPSVKMDKSYNAARLPKNAPPQQQSLDQMQQAQARNRKFFKNIKQRKPAVVVQQKQEVRGSPDSVEQEQDEIELLKQDILQQHLLNQQKIKERFGTVPFEGQSHNNLSKRNVSENKGRATLRNYAAQRKQKTEQQSLNASIDYGTGNNNVRKPHLRQNLQNHLNRQREKKEVQSLDDGSQPRRKFIDRNFGNNQENTDQLLRSNPQIPMRFKNNLAFSSINRSVNDSKQGPFQDIAYDDSYEHGHTNQNRSLEIQRDINNGFHKKNLQYQQQAQSLNVSSIDAVIDNDQQTHQSHSQNRNHILNLVPMSIQNKNLAKDKDRNSALQPQFDHMQEIAAKTSYPAADYGRRQKKNQEEHGSEPSSGKWRQPMGGASAAVSNDGFSMGTYNYEAKSHAFPQRPNMMFNTMYSGAQQDPADPMAYNEQFEPYATIKTGANYQRIQMDSLNSNQNWRGMRQNSRVDQGNKEPSLPQFPESKQDTNSIRQQNHSTLIAQSEQWVDPQRHVRQTYDQGSRNVPIRDLLPNQIDQHQPIPSREQTFSNGRSTTEQRNNSNYSKTGQASRGNTRQKIKQTFKQKRHTNKTNSQNSVSIGPQPEEQVLYPPEPLINHYQTRLHTRGPIAGVQNNEDLIAPENPNMMRTVQDWRSIRNSIKYPPGTNTVEIDEGIQKYIMSQQGKRKHVQTSQIRKIVNQTHSMQDYREIFSEEDFCNPDYHKFHLPEFSKQHHQSLFDSQNKKLEQQRQTFDLKAVRSSISRVSGMNLDGEQKSATLIGLDDGEQPTQQKSSIGANVSDDNAHPQTRGDWAKNPVWNSSVKDRNQNEGGHLNTNDSQVNPLLQDENFNERAGLRTSIKSRQTKQQVDYTDGAYETAEEQDQEVGALLNSKPKQPHAINKPRLSQQVAALIMDDEDDEESKDILDRESDDQAMIEGQLRQNDTDRQHERRDSNRYQEQHSEQQSAPDKEIFENSEKMDTEQIENQRQRESPNADTNNQKSAEGGGIPELFTFAQDAHFSSPPRHDMNLGDKRLEDSIDLLQKNNNQGSQLYDDYAPNQLEAPSARPKHETSHQSEQSAKRSSQNSAKFKKSKPQYNQAKKQSPTAVKTIVANAKQQTKKRKSHRKASQEKSEILNYVIYDQHQSQSDDSDIEKQLNALPEAPLPAAQTLPKPSKRKWQIMPQSKSSLEKRKQVIRHSSHDTSKNLSSQAQIEVARRQLVSSVVRQSELSNSNRKPLLEHRSSLPKSIHTTNNSVVSSQQNFKSNTAVVAAAAATKSRLSLERRQKQQVP